MTDSETSRGGYLLAHMDRIEPASCPCGWSRRAFAEPDNDTATFHVVDIAADARAHYHKRLTEIYYVLETQGEAFVELDNDRVRVFAGTAILIRPGTRHCAVGRMKIINCCIPSFDPQDEWFD